MDWSQWLRAALERFQEPFERGDRLRQRIGDQEYWRTHGEGEGAPWKLALWAYAQADPWTAWEACPRADWLLIALAQGGAEPRWRALCACDVARQGLPRVPSDLPQAVAALRAVEAWAHGEAPIEQAQELAHQVRARAIHLDTPARLAALGAAAPVTIAEGGTGADAAFALVASPDPSAVAAAHVQAVRAVLGRRWWPTEPGPSSDAAEPALWHAWEWLKERVPLVNISTVQVLVSYTFRWALVGARRHPELGYEPLHTAIAERVGAARHPVHMLDAFMARVQGKSNPELHPPS